MSKWPKSSPANQPRTSTVRANELEKSQKYLGIPNTKSRQASSSPEILIPRSNSLRLPHSRNQEPDFQLYLPSPAASSTFSNHLVSLSLNLPFKSFPNLQLIFHSPKKIYLYKSLAKPSYQGKLYSNPLASHHNFTFYNKPF
ncbi:hypothetical protein AVEN_10117-1 [Araneus ventricosus]|uniref:Uncharacterized protein n=1 Tax=Araneus ventricosus TaxID=182803 RepID=A0A4Y2L2B0_ARAVE|nr:hypothetical protein AVEN_10117-1 [Araneus ventricosus]